VGQRGLVILRFVCTGCKEPKQAGRACPCGALVSQLAEPKPPRPKFGRGPRASLPRVNRERKARVDAGTFGPQSRLVRTLVCCSCEKRPPSEAAHERSRGAGGKDSACVPLCGGIHGCHRRQHDKGILTFEAAQIEGFKIGDVRCATLAEVASYCADMVENHLCYEWPEAHQGAMRCLVCRLPIAEEGQVRP
jgi:hypothetical protein